MAGKRSKKPKRGKGKKPKKAAEQVEKEVDILSPSAMLNAYYVCHNAAAVLELRGFRWPGCPRAKGRQGRKRGARK